MVEQLYKFSGLVAFTIAWAGMLFVVHKQGRDVTRSISLHAASSKKTFALLAVLSPLSMGLFILFTIKWLMPTFDLSAALVALIIIVNLGYIFAAWVPAGEGIKGKLHDIFAYGASILLIPTSLMLALSPGISTVPRFINAIAALTMLAIFLVLTLHKTAKSTYLYYQIAYFLSFDFGLLAAGYL